MKTTQQTNMKTTKLFISAPLLTIMLLLLTVSTVFISCKKDTPPPPPPAAVTSCFDAGNNGVYTGDGSASGVPFTNTAVTITKLSCTSLKIESAVFSTITVNSLVASGPGGYNGTTAAGNAIAISFTGNDCSIGGNNELTFSGTR